MLAGGNSHHDFPPSLLIGCAVMHLNVLFVKRDRVPELPQVLDLIVQASGGDMELARQRGWSR